MPFLTPRARLLALVTLLALIGTVALVVWLGPRMGWPDPGTSLPSVLPTVVQSGQPRASAVGTAEASEGPVPQPEVLLAVGDISHCGSSFDEAVAELASELPGPIALLGDLAYHNGTAVEFAECFDPAWGPMRERLRPAPGNHEYDVDSRTYFDYFGAAAGDRGRGWYSYQLGAWHIVVLNSNCAFVACGSDSPQVAWLGQDLAAHPSDCLLAYWHHPRWSSGRHGSTDTVDVFWQVLADAGADVILNGHDHDYERVLGDDGVREFVVGTGGRSLYPFTNPPLPQTEVRQADAYGLLWLALGPGTYDWDYLALGDSGFTDSGSGDCD